MLWKTIYVTEVLSCSNVCYREYFIYWGKYHCMADLMYGQLGLTAFYIKIDFKDI